MQIKSEFKTSNETSTPSIEYVIEALRQDIHNIRAGNNSQDNCAYLTTYLLNLLNHYFYSAERPTAMPSANSSASDTNTEVIIKSEDGVDCVWEAIALRMPGNLHFELPPVEIEQYDLIRNEITPIVVLDNNRVFKKPVDLTQKDLNYILREEALTNGGMAYGHIALASIDVNEAGHMFVFVANEKRVIYIDAQLYNGITKKGDPFFFSIHKPYCFKKDINSIKQNDVIFSNRCFYLVHNHRKVSTLSLFDTNFVTIDSEAALIASYESNNSANQKKQAKKKQNRLINVITENSSTLPDEAISEVRLKKRVTSKSPSPRNQYVNAITGELSELTGKDLEYAKRLKRVVSKNTFFYGRQNVDAITGNLSPLTGAALDAAKADKSVISRSAFHKRKLKSRQKVDAITGELSTLSGHELMEAKRAKLVISRDTFNKRYTNNKFPKQNKRTIVEATTITDNTLTTEEITGESLLNNIGLFNKPRCVGQVENNEIDLCGEASPSLSNGKAISHRNCSNTGCV